MDLSNPLINALQNQAIYDHPVDKFRVIETHISWVILTGEYVYKIKKPVNFGFLDFSTLENRHFYCEEEVRLNQRLAPDIYLNVVPISGSAQAPRLNDTTNIIEYAVKMRQFSQDGLLTELLAHQTLKNKHIDQLTDLIAHFHADLPPTSPDKAFGNAESVYAPMQQNFEQISPLLADKDDHNKLAYIKNWTQESFGQLKETLKQRKQQGFIKECHGDLHLGNIALIDEKITIFDCIEFNNEFRFIDTINEIAFLIMDLEDREQHAFANRLLNRYLELTGDYHGAKLLNFYKVYRAMVRAKVNLFQYQQDSAPAEANDKFLSNYRKYIELAISYIKPKAVYLLVTHGVSGTGKTTISNRLIEELPVIRLRSDVERKRMFGLDPLKESKSVISEGIYHANATEKTYERLVNLAKFLLMTGQSVVIDATCLLQFQRQLFMHLAHEIHLPIIFISCQAPIRIIEDRIRKRLAAKNDASEADLKVLAKQLSGREPLTDEEAENTIFVDTHVSKSVEDLANQIHRALDERLTNSII